VVGKALTDPFRPDAEPLVQPRRDDGNERVNKKHSDLPQKSTSDQECRNEDRRDVSQDELGNADAVAATNAKMKAAITSGSIAPKMMKNTRQKWPPVSAIALRQLALGAPITAAGNSTIARIVSTKTG
jgi:hypothetical protein